MTYRYEDLGDEDFQRLISALVALDGTRLARAMPLGQADGGRDATDGPTTCQVKFTGTPRRPDPVAWLLAALDGEGVSIGRLVGRGTKHYVIATNVSGTGRPDVGTIDRLDRELETRRLAWGLDSLIVWWRDDVDARLAAAPLSMKLRFQRALTSDELLAVTLVNRSADAGRLDRALAAYVADCFDQDSKVRFEQADLNGPTVEKLFVDVPVICPATDSPPALLLLRIGTPGDERGPGGSDTPGPWAAGAARLLLHPDWSGNAVIVGGPGQGKTTLLQSICQFQRARHLGLQDHVDGLKPNGPVSALARLPLRIDLRRYAAWSRPDGPARDDDRDRTDPAKSLEVYLAQHVSDHSGGLPFTVEDLATTVADRPMLIALDGLDEVASLDERGRVASQISRAAVRLRQSAADLVILVATRPGATSVTSLLGDTFPVLHLQRLTEALRLRYLDKWAVQAGLDTDTTARLRATFVENYRLPHVRELASNPMQLAILLNLLQKRGILPEQRTRLYDDYIQVFLDREAPKDPVVRDHRALVEELHGFLAWHLQSTAEADGGSGALPLEDLRALLAEFLRGRGPNEQALGDLFTAVTSRVICLVHREAGFEFEVQPLREYFAARHIFENSSARGAGNSRDDCLDALLRRPYWSNVLRFLAGRLAPMEVRAVPSSLRTVLQQEPFDVLPLCRSTAAQLLNDQVFLTHRTVPIRDAVDVVLDGPGAVLAADGLLDPGGTFDIVEPAARVQVAEHCRQRLPQETDPWIRHVLAALLIGHADPGDIRSWWWHPDRRSATRAWLTTAADLGALADLTNDEVPHVLSCAGDAMGEPLVNVLRRIGYEGRDPSLLAHAAAELADGIGHDRRPPAVPAGGTALRRLYDWSHPALFTAPAVATAWPAYAPVAVGSRPRRRTRTRDAGPVGAVRRLEALHTNGRPWRTDDWLAALAAIRDGLGDGWLLREAALAFPGASLTSPTAAPALHGDTDAALLAWVAEAHRNRRDPRWWEDQRPDALASGPLAQRTFCLAAATIAGANAVQALVPHLDDATDAMQPTAASALILAAHRRAGSPDVRQLDIRDAVRLGHVRPNARTALLLHPRAFPATKDRLAPLIARGLPSLLTLTPEVARLATTATPWDVEQPVALFAGSRRALPPGTLWSTTRTAKPTVRAARDILAQPHLWPYDLVHLAADRYGQQLARQPALADVARRDRWFEQ